MKVFVPASHEQTCRRAKVIAFESRQLHQHEQNKANYSNAKSEMLALKWAVDVGSLTNC